MSGLSNEQLFDMLSTIDTEIEECRQKKLELHKSRRSVVGILKSRGLEDPTEEKAEK